MRPNGGRPEAPRDLQVDFDVQGDVLANGDPPRPLRQWPKLPQFPAPRRGVLLGVAVVLALVLTAFVAFRWGSGADTPGTAVRVAVAAAGPPTTAQIFAALAPSVVTIESLDGDGAVDADPAPASSSTPTARS